MSKLLVVYLFVLGSWYSGFTSQSKIHLLGSFRFSNFFTETPQCFSVHYKKRFQVDTERLRRRMDGQRLGPKSPVFHSYLTDHRMAICQLLCQCYEAKSCVSEEKPKSLRTFVHIKFLNSTFNHNCVPSPVR